MDADVFVHPLIQFESISVIPSNKLKLATRLTYN